jgi:ABC-2 type transport system permease protein
MNLSRTLALSGSNLKRTFREPSYLFLIIMFPIALTVLFGTAFGAVGGGNVTYQIGVVDLDTSGHQWSDSLAANLTATNIIVLHSYDDLSIAQKDLAEGRLQGVLVIPDGFNSGCDMYLANPQNPSSWMPVKLQLYLDPASMISVQAIPPVVQSVVTSTVYGDTQLNGPISLGTSQVATSAHLTTFDYMTPGIITFAAIFFIMIVGQSFALDREKGLLRRMNTTPMRASEFILSNVLSNMVIAVLQLGLVAALITVLGFHSAATYEGIALAFILVVIFSVCSVGFGLITAAVAKNPGQATMIAFAFIMPQMFLGTFVSANLSGAAQSLGAFFPAYYVTDGLNGILLRGLSIANGSILLDLAVVAAFSIAALIAGVALFQRYGNR